MIRRVLPLSIVSCLALWGCSGCMDYATKGDINQINVKIEASASATNAEITKINSTLDGFAAKTKADVDGINSRLAKFDGLEKRVVSLENSNSRSQMTDKSTDPPGNGKPTGPDGTLSGGTTTAQSENSDPNVILELARMHKKIDAINDLQKNHLETEKQLVDWVNGKFHPSIPALGPVAVAPPTTGELQIRNEMSSAQWVKVNERDWYVVEPYGGTRIVPVAPGNITTRITGEPAMTWFIGAPNYKQEIIIRAAPQNPLNPPATSWQYDPITGGYYRVTQ